MVAPRRSSSRISHRNVTLVHQTQKRKHQEELERLASIKRKRKPMEIYIQILTGRCITLSVSPDDTIEEVSEKIKMKEGTNPDQQTLLFNGIRLYEDATVDDYKMYEGSKLFLTVRGLGG
jgi:Ubiquitin family